MTHISGVILSNWQTYGRTADSDPLSLVGLELSPEVMLGDPLEEQLVIQWQSVVWWVRPCLLIVMVSPVLFRDGSYFE